MHAEQRPTLPSVAAILAPFLLLAPACQSHDTQGNRAQVAEATAPSGPREASASAEGHARPGFVTEVVDGRLWVFREGTAGLAEFRSTGEPAKSVTLIGRGPGGMTLRGESKEDIEAYLYSRPGFHTAVVDGRLWVLREGSEALAEFLATGEPAKSVTLIGRGPGGVTLRSDDRATIDAYLAQP